MNVEANRKRIGGGLGTKSRSAGRDDPLPEDRRLRGPLSDRVELLQGVNDRRERVAAEPALRRADPRLGLLAGSGINMAGPPQREPVNRPERTQVAVVAVPQLAAERRDLRRVLNRGRLGAE